MKAGPLKLENGTIYFVREQDPVTRKYTGLVKIGLVQGDRSPYKRLREHQTGNPRKLLFNEEHFVQTPAVKFVESQLHGRFAAKRVSGEWFQLPSNNEVEEAVQVCRGLATEMMAFLNEFEHADSFRMQFSSGDEKMPNEDDLAFANQLFNANQIVAKATEIIDLISAEIKWHFQEFGLDAVKGVAKVISVEQEPDFSVALFKKEHKKLWEELCEEYPQPWNPKFELTFSGELCAETALGLEELLDLGKRFEIARENKDLFELNEIDLVVRQILAPAEWSKAVAEVKLQISCGLNDGIKDVCEWIRKVQSRRKFRKDWLFEKHPEIYAQFIVPKPPKTSVIRLPFAGEMK